MCIGTHPYKTAITINAYSVLAKGHANERAPANNVVGAMKLIAPMKMLLVNA